MKVGDRLGRFELVRSLGKGSHGVVFEARDTMLGERVALKALHPWLSNDETLRERFKRELILTRRINHPGVCRLYDLHEEGETLFISMQFVEGRTLSQVIKTEVVDDARCVALMRGICGPLAAAHDAGVTHRDLKPGNVLVGDNDRVVVLDFGIATAAGVGQLTTPGQALGSVPFIPPEVWDGGSASALGDQYALGVIAFASLTRELPYTGRSPMEIVDAIRTTKPSVRARAPSVAVALEDVILRAIAVKPEDRYASVSALDAAFASALQPTAPSASAASSPAPSQTDADPQADDVDPLASASSVIELVPPPRPVSASGTNTGLQPESAGRTPGFLVAQAARADAGAVSSGSASAPTASGSSASSTAARHAGESRGPDVPVSVHEQVTLPMRRSELGVFGEKTAPSPAGDSLFSAAPLSETPRAEPARVRDEFDPTTAPVARAEIGPPTPNADDLLRSFVAAEGFDDGPISSPVLPPAVPHAGAQKAGREETRDEPPATSTSSAGPVAGDPSSRGAPPEPPSAAAGATAKQRPPARNDATVIVRVRDVDADLAAYEAAARRGRNRLVAAAVIGLVVVAVLVAKLVGPDTSTAAGDAGVVLVEGTGVDAGSPPRPAADVDAGIAAALVPDAGATAPNVVEAKAVVVDAGAGAPVEDGGSADAGELVIDDLVADAGAVTTPPRSAAGAPVGGDPAGVDVATLNAWRQVQAQARARGLRTGDAPAFDTASSKAQSAIKGRNRAAASSAVTAAKAALEAVVVDRTFVSEKLARFNRAFDGKDPALKDQLKPLTRDVLAKIGKKDWTGANATLNDGFARLAKGR